MAATANYLRLLSDPRALRQVLVEVTAVKPDGTTVVGRFGDEGWNTDPDETPPNAHFHRCLLEGLNTECNLLQPDGTVRGLGTPTLGAVVVDNLDGAWDEWAEYSVDQLSARVLLVGYLGDGTPVRYTDAVSMPLLVGYGIGSPQVGDEMRVFLRSALGLLERDAQPELYAPPCPAFPGSALEWIDFGDSFDLPAGSWTVEGFFYTEQPALAGQKILQKDPGSINGWEIDIGTSGSGVIRAQVREQANPLSTSAAGLVKQWRWTHFAVVFDSVASQRRLVLDGTTVTTTAGVTGNVTNTTAPFRVGTGLLGRVSWLRAFSAARSDATIRAEMYLPRTGAESGLLWDPRLDEGKLLTTADRKAGSSVTGTLTSGVSWAASAWIGGSLAGRRRRLVLGRAQDVELVARDAGKLVFEAGIGPLMAVSPYSMANPLAGGTYANDLPRGVTTLAPGTTFGRLTADVTGVVPWGWAVHLDGVNDYLAPASAVTCPAGSMTMTILTQPLVETSNFDGICGFRNGAGAGLRYLRRDTPGTNLLTFIVRNDAGTAFSCSTPGIAVGGGVFTHLAGVLDMTALLIRLAINGFTVATAAVSGTFNTVLNNFVCGSQPDAPGLSFNYAGISDAVGIFSRALTDAEIQVLTLRQLQAEDAAAYGLVQGWNCDEGTGTSVANVVGGHPALNLVNGPTWTPSRSAAVDLLLYLTARAGISFASVNTALAAAFLRDLPGEAGWVVEDGTVANVVDALLRGVGAALTEDAAVVNLDLVRGPSGSSAVRLTERDLTDVRVEGVPMGLDSWQLTVRFGRTWSPLNPEDVASIAASSPDRYNKATAQWQQAPPQDSGVLSRSPGARNDLVLDSCLTRQPDADALSRRLMIVYGPRQVAISLGVDTTAQGLRPLGELQLAVAETDGTERWGSPAYWVIVSFAKEEQSYRLTVWRKAV